MNRIERKATVSQIQLTPHSESPVPAEQVFLYMIRLLVDRPGRINISECAELTRTIRDLIDGKMLLLNYRLEVSSPGIGRLLSTEVDWIRSVGRKLSVQMKDENLVDWLEEYSNGCLKFRKGRTVATDDIVSAVEVLD